MAKAKCDMCEIQLEASEFYNWRFMGASLKACAKCWRQHVSPLFDFKRVSQRVSATIAKREREAEQ